jgi:hypothetical protein
MAEEFLDLPQVLSYIIKEDRRRAVAERMGGDLPHPDRDLLLIPNNCVVHKARAYQYDRARPTLPSHLI